MAFVGDADGEDDVPLLVGLDEDEMVGVGAAVDFEPPPAIATMAATAINAKKASAATMAILLPTPIPPGVCWTAATGAMSADAGARCSAHWLPSQ